MGLAALAVLVGAAIQSGTGLGFALILSPALFAVLDPVEAVWTLLLLGLALNLLVLFEGGRPEHVDGRRLAPVLVAALPGLVVGVVLLSLLSQEVLQVGVGVVVILLAAWQLRRRSGEQPGYPSRAHPAEPGASGRAGGGGGLAIGFLSGVLTTSISVNGPPIALWLEARDVRPAEFRATLAASFLALNLSATLVLFVAEGGGELELGVIAPLVGLVAVGYLLGARAFRRLDPERFFALALLVVTGAGVASLLAGLGVL